jgi:uncharacterized repeat protein (TIGR03803 family)
LYGTTSDEGSGGKGTVFALNIDGTEFTTLHSFAGTNGAFPHADLILKGDTLYGTAAEGGDSGSGTVFALSTNGIGFKVLHNFSGGSDGAYLWDGLILLGDTLYGTTLSVSGESEGNGTVLSVNIDGTGFTTLYSFTSLALSSPQTNSDGAFPYASLTLSGNTLYGTASGDGNSANGTIFSLSLPPPQLIILSSASGFFLTWPTNFTGYTLQSTTNLSSPLWTTNLPAAIVVNGQYTVTNPISGTQEFFRLSQ